MIWYRVQIGAYALKKSAEKVAVGLIEKGFKTAIANEGLLYKVRVGSFQDKAKANKVLARVHEYKEYEKAKILEWDDGKKAVEVIDIPADDDDLDDYNPRIDLVAIWLSESHESKYGDAQVFVEYDRDGKTIKHAILVDTGQNECDTVAKLIKLGIKVLDAVVISHAHGDHYGYLSTILKKFKVLHLYLPGIEGLKKYQKTYATAIQNQEKKAKKLGIPVTYLTTGKSFVVGHIECDCVYQVSAGDLSEHDNHHFVNNQSIITMFTLDGVGRVLLTGDLSNPANRVVMKKAAKKLLQADVAKCGWHGDGNAMLKIWAEFIGALRWYWNYHHNMKNGGRGNTMKKLIKAGVKESHVYRNYEDGDITFSYQAGWWTVTKSKDKKYCSKFQSRFAKTA